MINVISNCWKFLVLMAWLSLSIPCTFAQTANINVISEKVIENIVSSQYEVATPNINDVQSIKEVCKLPEPCQQFNKLVTEPVIQKSTDDSKAISNLTNSIYYLTLLMGIFTIFTPALVFFLQSKDEKLVDAKIKLINREHDQLQQDIKGTSEKVFGILQPKFSKEITALQTEHKESIEKLVNVKIDYIERTHNQLRQDMKGIKERIHADLRAEFRNNVMGQLEHVLDGHMKYYNSLVKSEIDQVSSKHEGRLFHAEKVHLDLMEKNRPEKPTSDELSEWIMGQQEDYVTLLRLISPDEEETFTALGFFQEREILPVSFLSLLRFLDKQGRLPGESRIKAMKIVKDKFGEPLEPQE